MDRREFEKKRQKYVVDNAEQFRFSGVHGDLSNQDCLCFLRDEKEKGKIGRGKKR